MQATTQSIKQFILEEFLPSEDPANLTENTPLFTTGVLDSIASLRLVSFLEEQFGISVQPHEVVPDNLDTLQTMTQFVESKRKG
jgi:acyl carrier protein